MAQADSYRPKLRDRINDAHTREIHESLGGCKVTDCLLCEALNLIRKLIALADDSKSFADAGYYFEYIDVADLRSIISQVSEA